MTLKVMDWRQDSQVVQGMMMVENQQNRNTQTKRFSLVHKQIRRLQGNTNITTAIQHVADFRENSYFWSFVGTNVPCQKDPQSDYN